MTNIFKDPEKGSRKTELFDIAVKALQDNGYKVERIERIGKSSIRRISKNGKSQIATIRTSQDTWIAFPRNDKDTGWKTLEDADVVVAASVDNRHDPRFAKIHIIPADNMRARFDKAREARLKAGNTIPHGRGVWLSIYDKEQREPVNLVGGGVGLEFPAIATVPLGEGVPAVPVFASERFTIADAKRKLAVFYDVPEEAITITITH